MARSFFLRPCLLICLACATPTPFPIENLEEGMTTETVREKFGEPEAIETEPEGAEPSWTYVHEEQAWRHTVMSYSIGIPHCIISTAWMPFVEGHPCYSWNVERKPVVLQFTEGKLTSWEVLPDPRRSWEDQLGSYSGYDWNRFNRYQWGRSKDAAHHAKGHKHHHGHGC